MGKRTIYFPHNFLIFAIFLAILLFVIFLLLIGVIGIAFAEIGFSATTTALILISTFLGKEKDIILVTVFL